MKKQKALTKKHDHSHDHTHHQSHEQAVIRLNRAVGHLKSVISMIESERPCAEILQQLSAVISALNGCRVVLFQDHLETCLKPALKASDQHIIQEISQILKQSVKA